MADHITKLSHSDRRAALLSRVGEMLGHTNQTETARFIIDAWLWQEICAGHISTQLVPDQVPNGTESVPQTFDFISPDPPEDPDRSSKCVDNTTSNPPKPPRGLTAAQRELLPVVDRLQELIRAACLEDGINPPADKREAAAITLEQAVRIDINREAMPARRVTAADLVAFMRWVLHHDFYRGQTRSLSNIRKKWAGGRAFAVMWAAWRKAVSGDVTPATVRAGGDSAPDGGYELP